MAGSRGSESPTATIALVWVPGNKRWRLDASWRTGRREAHRSSWVDTGMPLDDWAVARLVDAVRKEMEAWLPF